MKILAVNASPRRKNSNTLQLVEAALTGAAEAGADTEYLDLCEYDIRYCTACAICYKTGECPIKDDYAEILAKMEEADGLILGSPVYINAVTAQLKTLLDRMADVIHCQAFTGKYGIAVTTGGGGGTDEVISYLGTTLQVLGATMCGGVAAVMADGPERFEEQKTVAANAGKILVQAIREKNRYPEQEVFHAQMQEHMTALVRANPDTMQHEYEYLKNRGWLE
ncbi:flavodoxin family protein [Methanogenium sp. S4BF]|uniref:flavodoxin family protein n=1 Tax=Methanogenium sp. S4BF TaxID=1789226 RepID=UPI0024172DDB|nr:flavodoxin family protein [Methanogenium sp. S4BF]WFN35352.1 flavodoxin family protein [Methanogenium sp. S4BF]